MKRVLHKEGIRRNSIKLKPGGTECFCLQSDYYAFYNDIYSVVMVFATSLTHKRNAHKMQLNSNLKSYNSREFRLF